MSEVSDDLRAAIEAAADKTWDDGGSTSGGTATETVVETVETEGPSRDEAGRFSKKEGEAETVAAEEDDYEDGIGFERDAWGRLPQDLRPNIKSLAQQRREYEAKVKGYEPFDTALAPVRDAWTMAYGSPDAALKQLIAIEKVARENPTEFLRQFAAQRGLNPAEIFAQQQAAQPAQQDPMEIIRAEIRSSLQQETQQAEVQRALQSFEADASLEHRQNPAVRQVMAGLLQSGAAKDIKAAYEMAIYADPSIRAKLTADQQADRAKQDRERAAQAASERQSAAASVTGGPGTARSPSSGAAPLSLRDQIAQDYERLASGRI